MNDDWREPFEPDEHTVALYHFNEGEGDEAHDACGDPELTLRAYREGLWGSRPGFGATARFDRQNAHLLVGPADNDKLELRTCTREWTIEAWVRYTGPGGRDRARNWPPGQGYTFANICGSDEEGCALADGYRQGWIFYLRTAETGPDSTRSDGLLPGARFLGAHKGRDPNNDVGTAFWPGTSPGWLQEDRGRFRDSGWHHVAWQFRYRDQTGFLYVDGRMTRKVQLPAPGRASTRIVANDAERCDIPFQVGGFLRPEHRAGWTPGDFGMTMYNLEGEIDELRISNVMRFPVADSLSIIRQKLPEAGLNLPYQVRLGTDAAAGRVSWELASGSLSAGLTLDPHEGAIRGTLEGTVGDQEFVIRARDVAGATDEHTFRLAVVRGRLVTESLPPAFAGAAYSAGLTAEHMAGPLKWEVVSGTLPEGVSLDAKSGRLAGTAAEEGWSRLSVRVTDAAGLEDRTELTLKVLPAALRVLDADEHTVVLYDWQGPGGRMIPERVSGDEELALTYTNMGGDRRVSWPGREGRFPQETGHGEHGYAVVGQGKESYPRFEGGHQPDPRLDLKTCVEEWTVEAWVRRGGPWQAFDDVPLKRFDYGHICGTYDTRESGVWELYLSDLNAPGGAMAPGVHFRSRDHTWKYLHPWMRPKGMVAPREDVGIDDTEWHHVAWQYGYAEDLHQLFLDGRPIWEMRNPDGRRLVNDREHEAQFSVFSRLTGYTRYGGGFNYLGWGNFFGQIGEIRISDVRRY